MAYGGQEWLPPYAGHGNTSAAHDIMNGNLWSVVLAAGSGRRLSSLTSGIPKQFWRPDDGPSLIESTVDRLAPICPAERTIIVVGSAQRKYVREWPAYRSRGRVVFQPGDRGTAAGLLFGLVPVVVADPDGVVVITPSDHGIGDADVFRRGIVEAVTHAQLPGGIVLFGVEASAARDDYGWITLFPGRRSAKIQPVASFVEKPDAETASRLLSSGAIWNTMVIVARVAALIDLCRTHLPDVTAPFVQSMTMPRDARHTFLAASYRALRASDLSRDVLTPARNLFAYTWPASMGWSDLGTPERLNRWFRSPSPPLPIVGGVTATM